MTRRIGSFYSVEPAQGESEYFPRTLDGLCGKIGALQRAIRLSAGGQAQRVLLTENGATRSIREYEDGRETWRSGAGLIPPPDQARSSDQPEDVIQLHRPRTASLNLPPCSHLNRRSPWRHQALLKTARRCGKPRKSCAAACLSTRSPRSYSSGSWSALRNGARTGEASMTASIRQVREKLDRIHLTTGWDFAIKIETGVHCAWSAEIRITPDPHRIDGPDRSCVIFATGGLSPGDVLGEAFSDLQAWLDEVRPGNSTKPCLYCEDPEPN